MRLIDWGTANFVPPKGGKLAEVVGTPQYVAPEVRCAQHSTALQLPCLSPSQPATQQTAWPSPAAQADDEAWALIMG